MRKEKCGKRDKEEDWVCLVIEEGEGAGNYLRITKTTSRSSTAIKKKTHHWLNKITCAGNKARLKPQLLSGQESE